MQSDNLQVILETTVDMVIQDLANRSCKVVWGLLAFELY